MSIVESEIGQLEKAVNTLVRRPRLILQDYWASEIENVLARPGITARDRQRLLALVDLLGAVASDHPVQATALADGPGTLPSRPVDIPRGPALMNRKHSTARVVAAALTEGATAAPSELLTSSREERR
ncbi:hypothetical protein [Paraburkholderia kirstenboschensis]|uniref:Uncharacterized protein n=1 Tax=Paraburkholderia kirstenboschensis TaxID=1245436 RepID=A0ABZ0ER71_9BURK|nr:hypothetical protein [Paraburkholderia kirstenboschensis]WOD19094.1 hypothetical protein RW095_22790 [Paraburkholderia kirstenboschensis]